MDAKERVGFSESLGSFMPFADFKRQAELAVVSERGAESLAQYLARSLGSGGRRCEGL